MGPRTPLAELTTLHLGGPSRALIEVADEDELVEVVARLDRDAEPVLIVGGGSNLVVADAGFDGTVVRVATRQHPHVQRDPGIDVATLPMRKSGPRRG